LVKAGGFLGFGADARFFVITNYFLYNTHCEFNKDTGKIEFKAVKWYLPIKALTSIGLSEDRPGQADSAIELTINSQKQK